MEAHEHEGQVTDTEQELSKTQEELGARSGELDAVSNQYKQTLMQAHAEIEMLSRALTGTKQELSLIRTRTQNDIATRSQELADSQSEVAQLTRLKAQLEGYIADLDGKLSGTEQGLSKTQVDLAMRSQELEERCCSFQVCMEQQQAASGEMQTHWNADNTQLSEAQGDLASRSQELADSQREVEQLTERKAKLEGQIAVLDGKLASTEQALCNTKDDLATRSQELVDRQSEVAQLSQLKVQYEEQLSVQYDAQLQEAGKRDTHEHELTSTLTEVQKHQQDLLQGRAQQQYAFAAELVKEKYVGEERVAEEKQRLTQQCKLAVRKTVWYMQHSM